MLATGVAGRVSLRHIPFDFDQPVDFARSSNCQALSGSQWDTVIIDGQDKTFRGFITCFHRTNPLMQYGSIILVDHFWRHEELLSKHSSQSVQVYESVGPCRIGVTSTAMFFY